MPSPGISALCGIEFNGLTLQVLPYVTMGLGIDDMFVLLHYSNKSGRKSGVWPESGLPGFL